MLGQNHSKCGSFFSPNEVPEYRGAPPDLPYAAPATVEVVIRNVIALKHTIYVRKLFRISTGTGTYSGGSRVKPQVLLWPRS